MNEVWGWLGGALFIVVSIAGAWLSGRSKGKSSAENKAAQEKAQASVAAQQAVTERQSTVVKEASHAEQKVANSTDTDVDNELLNKWQRKD